MSDESSLRLTLQAACHAVGLDASGATVIRLGENAIFRLPSSVVVRVARPGQQAAAQREVSLARWLQSVGIAAVAVLPELAQPVVIEDRAVTFWAELPPHHHGSPAQVARALQQLHALPLPPPDVAIGKLDPFVRLQQRIEMAMTVEASDREWLAERLDVLRGAWATLAPELPTCVVHGDAWAGNVIATDDGQVVFLDLERCSVGPPEWDLTSTAVRFTTYGGIARRAYDDFAEVYGRDVLEWEHFELLRDIRELRMTCFVAQQAAVDARFTAEARNRVGCLQGKRGPRPWPWKPVA